jgi:hypothetical protein
VPNPAGPIVLVRACIHKNHVSTNALHRGVTAQHKPARCKGDVKNSDTTAVPSQRTVHHGQELESELSCMAEPYADPTSPSGMESLPSSAACEDVVVPVAPK